MATADASLNSLLGEMNPTKIMRRYFHASQRRTWTRLRKEGSSVVMGTLTDAAESGSYLATFLRRQAIQFEGMQTRARTFGRCCSARCASASFSARSSCCTSTCTSITPPW